MLYLDNKDHLIRVLTFLDHTIYFFLKKVFFYLLKDFAILPGYIISVKISKKYVYPFLYFLKFHSLLLFKMLVDLACCDFIGSKSRFTLVYNLLSMKFNIRLLVKADVNSTALVLSSGSIFSSSKWSEREVYEFYGIGFCMHRDLRHLLLDYGFRGYPLLKNFPMSGFIEVWYNDTLKKINYKNLEQVQEYRKNCLRRFLI